MTQQELELPKGWVETKLDDIAIQLQSGGTPSTKKPEYYKNGTIPFVKIDDITDCNTRYLETTKIKITEQGLENSAAWIVPENSILYTMYASYGIPIINKIKVATSQAMIVYRPPKDLISLDFVYYFLKFIGPFAAAKGTTQGNLNAEIVKNLRVLLPPLNEQKRMVPKIGELFSKIDSAKQSLEYTKLQLELYRQSLLNAAVSGTIFGNEEKYDQIPLSDVIDSIGQGWSPKCENIPSLNDEDWAVITTTAIQPMKFDDKQNKKLPQNLEPKLKLELEEDDLLITRAGPRSRVGITCLIKKTRRRLLLCDKAYRIRFKKTLVNPKFFEIVLNSPKIVTEINGIKTGTSDSGLNITMKRFSNLIIPLPSIKQQEQIVSQIEQGFSLIENSQRIVNSTLQTLETMRMSVLKQAFQGNIVPQDPNEEPASILLEKIKKSQVDLKPKLGRAKNVK